MVFIDLIMRNFILLIAVLFILGFTSGDKHTELVSIHWRTLTVNENGIQVSVELNFDQAAFPNPASLIPVYFRSSEINNGVEHRFFIENPVFEPIQLIDNFPGTEEIDDDIELNSTVLHSGEKSFQHIQVSTLKRAGNQILRLKSFELRKVRVSSKTELKSFTKSFDWKSSSVLKQGKWLKISINTKGIYKIPFSKLTSWGFTDPSKVSVFGSGGALLSEDPGEINYDDLEQCAIWIDKNNGADCLFFYAPGPVVWKFDEASEVYQHKTNEYSSKGFLYLTDGLPVKKTTLLPVVAEPVTHTVTTANACVLYENDLENVLDLGSGKKWFGEKFKNSGVRNIDFTLEELVTSEPVTLRLNGIARSYNSSEMTMLVNQSEAGRLSFFRVNTDNQTANYANEQEGLFESAVQSSSMRITLKYFADRIIVDNEDKTDDNALAWLDFIEINYRRKLSLGANYLFFSDYNSVGAGNIAAFTIENSIAGTKVFDISDQYNLKEIPVEIIGKNAIVKRPSGVLTEYVAVNPNGNFAEPELVGDVINQYLHAMNTPEFVIITHPAFINAATRLAEFHRAHDGMSVEVVNSEQVYNEFSSGERNATGIRNFVKMLYDRNNGLKYVLLFGDGSFDNRAIRPQTKNFIPTYQSENSLEPVASFVTDDYFVILEPGESVYNGSVDLGIGRIPASTSFEADLVIDKIEKYYSPEALGNWRNHVCFIGDDEDGALHMSDSEKLANILNTNHKEFITSKIYLDAHQQIVTAGEEKYPDVTAVINNRVKEGVLILNYVGHANERFMADEHVLDISNVNSWSNTKNLPVFVTATCEFSRFDTDLKSIGEYILFNANGGGVGLFSTTRVVFAYSNFLLSQSFYSFVFKADKNGNRYRMGDIMRLAKNNTINTTNKRNFSLLADPALRLSYPKYQVKTTKINNLVVSDKADTLKALDKVTVEGVVTDFAGNALSNFTGKMSVTVYDKETTAKTLGNNGETPFSYKVMENILYKGTASVVNGTFSFSFVVPKDISFLPGQGKIIYYAQNGESDAHGAYNGFVIGGIPNQVITDNKGPDINMYMDSRDFINGGKTSKNPLLLAELFDDNGINTAGTGIGHDITAILDDDYSRVYVLNQYYNADINDFKSGVISFPFQDIQPGKHKLKLKAWDVANNSSEAEIEFEVTNDFIISLVQNTPNPAVNFTSFQFEHNQADATLDVMIEIFDHMGRRIEYIISEVGSAGLVSNPVMWNFNSSQLTLRNGIYIYRITARNNNGVVTSASGKMLIAR